MAQITDDLQNVLDTQDPQRVNILIEAEPGQGGTVADLLDDQGIEYNRVDVRAKAVFQATVTQAQIGQLVDVDPILRLDYSPTFSPLGAVANPGPSTTIPEASNAQRTDLYEVSQEHGIEEVWEQAGTRGQEVTLGMIDTTIDSNHPAIQHAVASEGVGAGSSTHGTWVAGAMVAQDTEARRGRVRGLAPEADLHVYGALAGGGASVTEIGEGIEYMIEQDVDWLNLSLGGPHSEVLQSVVEEAYNAGIVVVSSAGNSGPAPGTISCPAHHEEAIAVGSVSTTDRSVAAFSGRGPGYPDAIQKPDVMAYGGSTTVAAPAQQIEEAILGPAQAGGYGYLLGTSMAAPQVAAIGGLRTAAERVQNDG